MNFLIEMIHSIAEQKGSSMEEKMQNKFLPLSKQEMQEQGIKQFDFVYVIGDACVDHPSFGSAIISRLLEVHGFSVGIIAQPNWKEAKSIMIYGEPRLGFLVSSGNMDSMVNHYSVSKKKRSKDSYTPGGVMGKRPDYAVTVYSQLIRQKYPKIPIILGGIEASLRRLAHYDYWGNRLQRSVLLDAEADIISYGMGERSIIQIAEALQSGLAVRDITFIEGTVCKVNSLDSVYDYIKLPSYQELRKDKLNYARSFYTQYTNTDPLSGKRLVESYGAEVFVIQNPPALPLEQHEMDRIYALPFTREYHPSYEAAGGILALEEVKYSLVSNRGCFGGCNFCALTFHQGRIIQTRSHESLLAEAKQLIWEPDFKGYIHDVGGPTANFRDVACKAQRKRGACTNKQCLFPKPCMNLKVEHKDYLTLLQKLRELPNVKKVFVRSGIRFDYLIYDKDESFFKELVEHHVSGQLKVAPEHIADSVLAKMGKPEVSVYNRFAKRYKELNQKCGKNQFLVPYLMSSHPGSTLKEAIALAEYLRDLGYMPEQVQDFYPTPSTISTCMYYTGVDPRTMETVYVPITPHEKAMQRALIQYRNPKNYQLVEEALIKEQRQDLIGYGKDCLIRPRNHGKNTSRRFKTNGGTVHHSIEKKKAEEKPRKRKTIRNIHKKKGHK